MFRRVLIANRGEIALRILRACRALGVEAVVAYSEADRESLPVQLADEAICIGPADARRVYLSAPAVISAAARHRLRRDPPGLRLPVRGRRVRRCRPRARPDVHRPVGDVLERFASKEGTRRLLAATACPRSRAPTGCSATTSTRSPRPTGSATRCSIKPSAGGGGKGMRMVRSPRELEAALQVCRSEARAAFGDDSLYLERWLEDNRHVEVQVAVDRYGHGVHLGERDCSVQRRHQKILEEAPDAGAVRRGRAPTSPSGRSGPSSRPATRTSGTLEFLVDRDGNAYFIEINCRIQVEHPVTEMLTGIDLVATQIRIAAGEPLGISPVGHLAPRPRHRVPHQRRGCRRTTSGPGAGIVERYLPPGRPGVRMDSHLYSGYEVPPYYDSLLGKLIVWGPDRDQADRARPGRARRARRRRHRDEPADPPGAPLRAEPSSRAG